MSNFLNALNNIIWGPPLIILMIVTGVYFTLRTKFFQVRHLGYIFSRTLGRLFHRTDESADEKGLLTPYEAIATAVGGSVGFGNIAGVATAVTTGGPGAVFWMWLTAFLGMLIKQVEVTLAVYYRRTDENGVPYGGPTYYMERGLGEERHWGKLWLPLAFVFGIGIFSTFFISASTFTTSEVVAQSLGIPQAIAALIIVAILYFMIWGGVKKLGQILTKLVPVMSLSLIHISRGLAADARADGLGLREVVCVSPGASGATGIPLAQLLAGLVRTLKPAAIVCVDSLCTSDPARLGRTIQISDTGLSPARPDSGRCITRAMLGVPVLAVGVPTLMEADECVEGAKGLILTCRQLDGVIRRGSCLLYTSRCV